MLQTILLVFLDSIRYHAVTAADRGVWVETGALVAVLSRALGEA